MVYGLLVVQKHRFGGKEAKKRSGIFMLSRKMIEIVRNHLEFMNNTETHSKTTMFHKNQRTSENVILPEIDMG